MTNEKEIIQQQTQPTQLVCPMMSEAYAPEKDELNLLDYIKVLIKVLWKHKFRIFYITLIAAIYSVPYALSLPNVYRSEATIIPRQQDKTAVPSAIAALGAFGGIAQEMLGLGGGGSIKKFEIVLKSRVFANEIYLKHKSEILPALYEEAWDKAKDTWITDKGPHPSIQDVTRAISKSLIIKTDKNTDTISIQVEHHNPVFAKKMVNYYLNELSETLREETLKDAAENQRFLRKQLGQTADVLLKEKIYTLLAREIEKETFARAQDPYSFQILDPPIVPEGRLKPDRRRTCLLFVVIAGLLGIFLAFFLEYIHDVRKKTQESQATKKSQPHK